MQGWRRMQENAQSREDRGEKWYPYFGYQSKMTKVLRTRNTKSRWLMALQRWLDDGVAM